MSPQELILKIVKAYHDARKPVVANERVRRGRSHGISSVTEDLFADFLIKNDSLIEAIYVDQPIHIPGKVKQFFPDLTIVRKGKIVSFIDIKMDLGWKRDGLHDMCLLHQQKIIAIRGDNCHFRDGLTKMLHTYPISPRASYNVVVISRTNINPRTLSGQLEKVKDLRADVDVFVMCDTGHPNHYGLKPREIVESLSVNEKEFKRLLAKIK